MASQATRQRKGGVASAPKSGEFLANPTNMNNTKQASTTIVSATAIPIKTVMKVAKVKRDKCGTGPFDKRWLNMDCCGLFCASITYMLHMYGVYATCLILIPPWMSTVDEDGIRTISLTGHLNRVTFTLVAVLAVYAHFKAMTTDPGAVPPDAIPLEESNNHGDIENLNKNKNANIGENKKNGENGDQQTSSLMVEEPAKPPSRKGRRLCRRCNSFKPKRAHHCSICKRCIIKMDRKSNRGRRVRIRVVFIVIIIVIMID